MYPEPVVRCNFLFVLNVLIVAVPGLDSVRDYRPKLGIQHLGLNVRKAVQNRILTSPYTATTRSRERYIRLIDSLDSPLTSVLFSAFSSFPMVYSMHKQTAAAE